MRRSATTLALAALVAAVLAGCAGMQRSPEDALRERVDARWAALIAGDLQTAYGFLSPGYRSGNDLEAYRTRMRARTVAWKSAEVREVECDEEGLACRVRTRVAFEVPMVAPGVPGKMQSFQVVVENWIRSRNRWYFVPEVKAGLDLS